MANCDKNTEFRNGMYSLSQHLCETCFPCRNIDDYKSPLNNTQIKSSTNHKHNVIHIVQSVLVNLAFAPDQLVTGHWKVFCVSFG